MRGKIIENSFRTIQMLQRKDGVSAAELAAALEIAPRNAYRYIDAASLVLPVWERGRPKRFKLLEEGDFR